ncbi:MAG: allophanate hydrolase subunit 1, partial [Actinomycetota bacterium]|nr:allophanate hydrolase subunit 1 [Actinomycetota bacterium]
MNAAHDVRPYGSRAFLVTPGGGVSPASYARAVVRPEVVDVVPAAATVLVVLRSGDSRNQVADWLRSLSVDRAGSEGSDDDVRSVVIDVVYDGEDLAAVAAACGLAVEAVVSLHTGAEYTCEFCGFAPGFGYLSGLPDSLVLARRSTPRTSVPAGSVAIGGRYSAVYPSASPGGWHLVGRTDSVL